MPAYALLAIAFILPIYWFIPVNYKRHFLTFASLSVLILCGPLFAAYISAIAYVCFLLNKSTNPRKYAIASGFFLGAMTIAAWKYLLHFFTDIQIFSPELVPLFATIGVTFLGIRITGLYFSVVRGEVRNQSYWDILGFLCFFPTIAAGPIIVYGDYIKGKPNINNILPGLYRVFIGLFKKIFIIDYFINKHFGDLIFTIIDPSQGVETLSKTAILMGVFVLFLKAYLEISAYADIVIGVSHSMGYKVPEDVSFPLWKKNLAEFWQSWHITPMKWCRDNVYTIVYFKYQNAYMATFAALLVMGLWHNLDLKWFVWGVYQAVGLCTLIFLKDMLGARHKLLISSNYFFWKHILTFWYAAMAFLIMGPRTFDKSIVLIKRLLF